MPRAAIARPAAAPDAHWLNAERVRGYSSIIFGLFAVIAVGWIAWSLPALVDPQGNPVGIDFIGFWSAARLAVTGRPEAAYDWATIQAVEHAAVPALPYLLNPFVSPPTLLLVLAPFGWLPYPLAFAVFVAGTTALWALLVRRLLPRPAWIVAAATPAGLINVLIGQYAFLTAGLAGLALLRLDRRPMLAGMLIGLLCVKPHLAVLFPLALLAEARWQTIAAAAATAAVLTFASLAAFGWGTYAALFAHLPQVAQATTLGAHWRVIPTPFIFALSLRLPVAAAEAIQAMAALGAAVCVWRAWRNREAPFEAKAATLVAGSLLCSPYLSYYDLTWAALAIAFLAVLGMRTGFRRGEREIMLLAWVLPVLMPLFYVATSVQIGFPALALLLFAAIRRAMAPAS